jgi:pimeloyl-ACP methyl ester carboxylesterase
MYVSIGGIEQWIQIGGAASDHPVLLFLHGGPGGSSRPAATAWKPWEEHFAVVHWDQRGAGRTFAKNGEAVSRGLTVERMVLDGIEVAEFLIRHLGKEKILLVGHSWGSVLGVHMLKRRPDLFSAYIGTGQVVNMQRAEELNYRRELTQAERLQNSEALQALIEIGPPPYSERAKIKVLRQWADQLADGNGDSVQFRPIPPDPAFSNADDVKALLQGAEFTRNELFRELSRVDLPTLGPQFDMPIFFFEGTCDQATPMELAESYFAEIVAPHKEFVRFEGCHHFVVMNRPIDFLRELLAKVRPWL